MTATEQTIITDRTTASVQMPATSKPRLMFIDMAKGVGILWVIAVHTSLVKTSFVYTLGWCSAFALPMFFLLSGLFHRDQPVKNFILKKCCQLLIPFVCFEILGAGQQVLSVVIGNNTWNKLLKAIKLYPWEPFNGPTWFLLALFETACLYDLLRKFKNRTILWMSIVVLAVFGFYISRFKLFGHHCYLPFFIGQALAMLPLFALGHLIAGWRNGLGSWSKKVWLCILPISLGYIVVLSISHCFGGVQLAAATYRYNFIFTLGNAVAGSMLLMAVCGFIQCRAFEPLAYIGKFSLIIMGTHLILLRFSYRFLNNGVLQFLTALAGSVLLCIPISRYCPFLCGKMKSEQLAAIFSAFFAKRKQSDP